MKRVMILSMLWLAWSTAGFAAPLPDDPQAPRPGPAIDEKEMDDLQLSDAQKKTMQELRLQHHKELVPLRSDLELLEIDLKSAMTAEKVDLTRINGLVDKIARARAEIEKKQIALRFKLRDQLTPEQRKIWDQRIGRRGERLGRHGMEGRAPRMGRGADRLECPAGPDAPAPPRRHGFRPGR